MWRNIGPVKIPTQFVVPVIIVIGVVVVVAVPVLVDRARHEVIPASPTKPAAQPQPAPGPRERSVLRSRLAGRWYDADPERLAAEIQGYLDKAEVDPIAHAIALILPHAGYRYSGQTAAYGLAALGGRMFKRVVVLGPSHGFPMKNRASVPGHTHYATPLGEVPLDTAFIDALLQCPEFETFPSVHVQEHSVQIELPILQQALGEFTFVPIVVGRLDLETSRTIGRILRGLIDNETLVVASSDFTHYGRDYDYVPFTKDVPENIEELDMGAFAEIAEIDDAGFMEYVEKTKATICGRCPIAVLLAMLPEDASAHLARYDTSGAMTGDFSRSVSYVSVVFTGAWPDAKTVSTGDLHARLTEEDRRRLLRLARETLAHYMEHRSMPTPEDLGIEATPAMRQVMGAFVTLHKEGRLRGCIGEIFPQRPLYEAVMDHAVNAALRDRRFRPVTQSELPDLEFEISALYPPVPVASYDDIVLGQHGVVLNKNGRTAVFLPQVALEQGWNLEQTLEHLAMKAGLPQGAWREGASFTVFEADVFGEA